MKIKLQTHLSSRKFRITVLFLIILLATFLVEATLQILHFKTTDFYIHIASALTISAISSFFIEKLFEKNDNFHRTLIDIAVVETVRDAKKAFDEVRQAEKAAIEEERRNTHLATLMCSYHYLNNILHQFQFIMTKLESNGTVNQTILDKVKTELKKTEDDMREFGKLENVTKENVEFFIKSRL